MKERLVGAAVLMAAAIILIPEMLSGPRHEKREQPAGAGSGPPLKTYTIDLSQSPAAQGAPTAPPSAPPEAIQESAPPAEQVVPLTNQPAAAEPESAPETTPESASAPPPADVAAVDSSPAPIVSAPPQPSQPADKPAAVPANQAVAQGAAAPRPDKGWAVQLITLASRTRADSMAEDLRAKGFDAFVMPIKSGGATLYRVRIGPVPDREAAAETLRKVKPLAPGAAVVPHP